MGTRAEHAADAHLRDRVLQPEGSRRAPRAARAGAGARPPAARRAARSLPLRRALAGVAVLASEGDGDLQRARGSATARERAARLLGGEDAADLRQGALGHLGPLGEVPREHVPDPDRRRAHLRGQADELPGAHAPLRQPAAELPRAAAALRRSGAAAPQRARGRAPRAHPRPVRDPGRRAHLLLPGADRRRARRLRSSTSGTCTGSSGSSRGPSSRRGPTTSSAPTRSGTSPRASSIEALDRHGIAYFVGAGEGSFYGPKIDLHITDALDRSWQLGHDPARRADAGPVRAHLHGRRTTTSTRSSSSTARFFGSLERFIGIIIEHYGGALPALARARPGARARRSREQHREGAQRDRRRARARPGTASRSTSATRRSASGSATARSRRCRYVVVFGERESDDALAVRTRGEGQSTRSLDELLAELAELVAPSLGA